MDWLNNKSFSTEAALSIHQRVQQTPLTPETASFNCEFSGIPSQQELEDSKSSSEAAPKTKKKKKQKRKKSHSHRKRKRDFHEEYIECTSDSESRAKNTRQKSQSVLSGRGIWLDEAESMTEETFRIDKKADPANWEYKSLYRGDIALYKRKGNSCLGINLSKQQIVWEKALSEKKQSSKRNERYFTKVALQLLQTPADHVYNKDKEGMNMEEFIPLVGQNKYSGISADAPVSWVNPLGVYDSSTAQWLQGKGCPSYKTPPKEERDKVILAKVEDYNKRIRDNPGDIQLWMEFVTFQDELVKQPSMYSTIKSELDSNRLSVKVLMEKKLSILERAIESNPSSTELKLARLRLCEEFWEAPTLLKEWQKLTFLYPHDPQLWQKYLLFCQSQFSTFTVAKMNGIYGKCLTTLAAVQDGSMLSHHALPGTENHMFDIFLQQCHFLRQAGHTEKVVSLFQALIDFTFYKPDSVKDMSTKEQVDFFEPFWDSGEPRFGEKEAKGWRSWMRQQERGGWVVINKLVEEEDDEEEPDEEFNIKGKNWPKYKIWLDAECAREARHWLPWRPDPTKKQTEEDCEDPERQVFFDDLGPSMFKISSIDLQFQLLKSFLHFLGVPCGSQLSPLCLYLSLDETSIFEHIPLNERLFTTFELPLSGIGTLGSLDTMSRKRQQMGKSKDGECFIQNVFQSALSLLQGEQKMILSVWWLQYEISKVVRWLQTKNKKKLKSQGKRSKRLAKNLLKEASNRNSLALWKEYALLEWLLGNLDDSRKVFDTAISLAGRKGLKDQELCSLCLLYAELEGKLLDDLSTGVGSRAIHILTSLTESSAYTPYTGPEHSINILKARKVYEHALQDILKDKAQWGMVSLSGCFALFQYLTVSIDAALIILQQVSDLPTFSKTLYDGDQDSITPQLAITLMHTNLLLHHSRVSVYPLSPLRDRLISALKQYPANVTLWKYYIRTESKSHSANKTRRFIDTIRRVTTALEPLLFAIKAEEERWKLTESVQRTDMGDVHSIFPETGLTNRIKGLYEHALHNEFGSVCPLLWRMYLYFLISMGNKERSKGLFYKAIQSCPWAKGLYMDAIEYFPDQLQEIIDLMTEKELRVRIPIEELDLLLEY
ncbi:hypothetical protein GDO86_015928 [Hymenochirus boettgeri]|uniref:NRDE-2, necessary for RNA interference, domain containing n=1 Tax=Hymenochirus boettgeri TaxID=247094 RepID=A0A8T2K0X5_9PIPI|nr:hypothetical protein GDO86_015928 [Hymenochirus boettgeri]